MTKETIYNFTAEEVGKIIQEHVHFLMNKNSESGNADVDFVLAEKKEHDGTYKNTVFNGARVVVTTSQ